MTKEEAIERILDHGSMGGAGKEDIGWIRKYWT